MDALFIAVKATFSATICHEPLTRLKGLSAIKNGMNGQPAFWRSIRGSIRDGAY
ncbi:MAG: hypothetical protein ACRCWF_15570 [Beijerinckiaceae bacterium]